MILRNFIGFEKRKAPSAMNTKLEIQILVKFGRRPRWFLLRGNRQWLPCIASSKVEDTDIAGASSNHFKMCGPRAANRNAESTDSCDNQRRSVTVQTEWSHVQGTNYQESVEENSTLQLCYMIGQKVYKMYGEKIYEGSVESYNIVTHKFKVVYGNGCFDEIAGDDLISYLMRYREKDGGENASPSVPVQPSRKLSFRSNSCGQNASPSAPAQPSKELSCGKNNGGQNASPSAPVQPSKKLPSGNNGGGENASPSAPVQPSKTLPRGYATGKVTTGDSNNGGRVRTRPLMMRAENAGGTSRTRQARKQRVESSSRKRLTGENVNQTAPVQSLELGTQGTGRKRALRTRAENAGDINPPRQASKRALRMRAENAGDVNPPRQASKRALRMRAENAGDINLPRQASKRALRMRAENAGDINPPRQANKRKVRRSSKRRLLYEEYKRSAYVYYSPGADEDNEDSDWEE